MLEILQYPFMIRALLAGVILGALLSFLGTFVILKKMSFFADGIAHASLAGVAIGIVFSFSPLITAIIFSAIFALIIYTLEKKFKLSSDTTIGIIFTSGLALGVLLISLQPGYQPELITFLFGNILAIDKTELILITIFSIIIISFFAAHLKKITLLALDIEMAYLSGIKVSWLQPILYIALAVAVVSGIKVLGIILVSALLIIPVATSKLFANSFKKLILFSLAVAEIIVICGLIISYYLDIPTGPTIVLTGTVIFSLSALIKSK